MLDEQGRRDLEMAYRTFGPDVWRAVFGYAGGNRDVADEAVSEAFAQAGRRLPDIRSLRPWIYRAAFRIAAGELHRRGRRRQEEERTSHEPAAVDQSTVEIIDLLRDLSPMQRGAFVLREVFGYDSGEAASLLGTSEVAVRVHLHAARRRLRNFLDAESLQ